MKNVTFTAMILAIALSVACNSQAQKEKETEESTNLLLLSAVAYSTTRSLPILGSCQVNATSCEDYHTGWSNAQMATDCSSVSGTLTTGGSGCATANRVASCLMTGRGITTVIGGSATATARYYSPTTVGTATTGCNAVSGTLSVP